MTSSNTTGVAPAYSINSVANVDRRFVNAGAQLTAQIQRLYSFFLWDLDTGEVIADARLDPSGTRQMAEYFFSVPPKVHELTEPYTTKVVATQNGGKFIESHGSIFKDIRLQGTTGLRPRKQAATVIPLFSTQSFDTLVNPIANGTDFFSQVREIPNTEVTGFDDIHFMRNIFRLYSDVKSTGRKVVMVWRNIKDADYWIVEPKDFRLTQNSKSPLTYEYQINFQGIARFDQSFVNYDSRTSAAQTAHRFASRMQEYQQALKNSFLVIASQASRIRGAGYNSMDALLSPLNSVINGLASINSANQSAARGLLTSVSTGLANFTTAVATLSASMEPYNDLGGVTQRNPIVRELRNSIRVFNRILSEKSLQDSVGVTATGRRNRMASAYRRPGTGTRPASASRNGGSPAFVGNAPVGNAVSEDRMQRGETVRDMARRLLGDARRWHEIVVLNDLRPPYTSDSSTTRPGVLAPGDSFYYPSKNGATAPQDINPTNVSDNETDGEGATIVGSLAAQAYGRDIRLVSTEYESTDLAVNQQGDISTIVGVPNVNQAIRIKFSTEYGELPAHPQFGAKYSIGSKMNIASFNQFRILTIATMASDPRILDIKKLEFMSTGDILAVSAEVILKNANDVFSTNFALRRF